MGFFLVMLVLAAIGRLFSGDPSDSPDIDRDEVEAREMGWSSNHASLSEEDRWAIMDYDTDHAPRWYRQDMGLDTDDWDDD